ncbi:MAG: hypothetical protein R6U40_06365 [Desulfobacterales bacterium]
MQVIVIVINTQDVCRITKSISNKAFYRSFKPLFLCNGLALGAVAVAARIVGIALVTDLLRLMKILMITGCSGQTGSIVKGHLPITTWKSSISERTCVNRIGMVRTIFGFRLNMTFGSGAK